MPESLVIELKEGTGGGGGSSPPSNTLPGGGFTPPPMEELFRGTAPTQEMLRAQQVNTAALVAENDQQRRLAIMRQQKVRLEAEWLRLHQIGNASPVELFKQQELDQMQKRVMIQEMELKARSGWVEKTVQAEREYAEARSKFAKTIDAERQKQEKAEFGARVEKAGGGAAGYIKASLEDARGGKSGGMAGLLRQMGGILGQQGQAAASSALGGGALGQMGGAALGAAGAAGPIVGGVMIAKQLAEDALKKQVEVAGAFMRGAASMNMEAIGDMFEKEARKIPLVGEALADMRQHLLAVDRALEQNARTFAQYDGVMARTAGQIEMVKTLGDIERSQYLGPDTARFMAWKTSNDEREKNYMTALTAVLTRWRASGEETWSALLDKFDWLISHWPWKNAGAAADDEEQRKKDAQRLMAQVLSAARGYQPGSNPPRLPGGSPLLPGP